MSIKQNLLADKRLLICTTIFTLLAAIFWSNSRYPALDMKAAMSDTLGINGGLSFDANYDLEATSNIVEKIAYTLLNWIEVNEQGMMFGLALSIILLVLLPLLVNRLPQGRVTSIISGLMLGIPLGLCVNCSAPIAYGLYQRQARAETALVTMLSSPLLNIIVLTMAFSLFPSYLVLIKIFFSLILILFVVPFIVQLFPDEIPKVNEAKSQQNHFSEQCEIPMQRTWRVASLWVGQELLKQGVWLLKKMLPLMLLAGLIGAILITLVPWHTLIELLPQQSSKMMLIALILLAFFALILPVPITFDIIFAAVLFVNDVPVIYIAALLFTLGSFSIYSWLVLVKTGAIKTASALAFVILIFGVLAGVLSDYYQKNFIAHENSQAFNQFKLPSATQDNHKSLPLNSHNIVSDKIKSPRVINGALVKIKPQLTPEMLALKKQDFLENTEKNILGNFKAFDQLETIEQTRVLPLRIHADSAFPQHHPKQEWHKSKVNQQVEYIDLTKKISINDTQSHHKSIRNSFQYSVGKSVGFNDHPKPLYEQFIVPFIQTNALASGDFNNDGWQDVVVGTYNGVYLYQNNGGHFTLSPQSDHFAFDTGITGAVALQDIDNNGWPDLVWSSNKNGGFIAYNHQGQFSNMVKLPVDSRIAFAIAFDDINNDGKLDIFWGQYFNQWMHNRKSQNLFLIQQNDEFIVETLPGPPGSALSALFSDINADGKRELLIGNEFEQPDMYYLSPLEKEYKSWLKYWPAAPFATMSLSSADIDNDLSLESYHAQITFNPSAGALRVPLIKRQALYEQKCDNNKSAACQALQSIVDIVIAKRTKNAAGCLNLPENAKFECLALLLTKPNLQDSYEPVQVKERLALCQLLQSYSLTLQQHCIHKLNIIAKKKQQEQLRLEEGEIQPTPLKTNIHDSFIKQKERFNMLYKHGVQKQALDIAPQYGIDITGWAWNAKFADLDGDSWQDLFVVNGYSELQSVTSNAWYHNQAGKVFVEQAEKVGLAHYNDMLSYLYIDSDNDSDLDIIAFDIQGKLHAWQNNNSVNNHIQIELNNTLGNNKGIGAKVIIYYGKNSELKQIREMKASGGFLSMDAPILHFGIGQFSEIAHIKVLTPENKTIKFIGPFQASRRYKLTL